MLHVLCGAFHYQSNSAGLARRADIMYVSLRTGFQVPRPLMMLLHAAVAKQNFCLQILALHSNLALT